MPAHCCVKTCFGVTVNADAVHFYHKRLSKFGKMQGSIFSLSVRQRSHGETRTLDHFHHYWCSNPRNDVTYAVTYLHSLSRVIPKDFKNGIHSFPARRSAYKRDSVENKPASLLVVSLGKARNGTPPPICGRKVALSYFTGLQLLSC